MKLSIEQKMQRIKRDLDDNCIKYVENRPWHDVTLPLLIPNLGIVIHPDDSQDFYDAIKFDFHPIFVRDSETLAFIFEKVHNTIIRETKRAYKNAKKV